MEPLTPDRWRLARVLFEEAAELPPAERGTFLQAACEDAAVRKEVEAMLAADAVEDDMLDGRVHELAPRLLAQMRTAREVEEASGIVGVQIGSYRVLREIGRGGMSVIYLAERSDGQFEQCVALKLIKRGMDSDAIVQRFLRERQILARLQHPGIARLYDGGLNEEGQPYFAMEYVAGEPLISYADRQRLNIDARLRLFVDVCEAVQYAHRNLVVHRDIKPANVLVTDVDGEPLVKLLDFGIAKLLDDDPGADILTQTGVRVHTPAYAAPEQLEGEPITTQTDVYALGALLYELLTGHRSSTATDGAVGTVTRPSLAVRRPLEVRERVGDSHKLSPESVGVARGISVEKLRRRLVGDLDTICLKALRREPERRYASAEELAEDIRRHLDRLPVRARPDTLVYRAQTFVARHRIGVAAAAVAVLSLVSGLAVAIWQADVARRESDQKQVEALRATATLDYILDLFRDVNPAEAQGRRFSARDLIEPGLRRLDDLRDQPLDYAAVAQRLGQLSGALGQFSVSDTLLARALEIQRSSLGSDAAEVATTLELHAHALQAQARYDEADSLLERALAIRRLRAASEPSALILTLNQLGHVRLARGDPTRAEAAYVEAIALQERGVPAEPDDLPRSRRGLAEVHASNGNLALAIALFERSLRDYVRLLGSTHTETARTRFSLALAYQRFGDIGRADSLLRDALQAYGRVYGNDNQQVGVILANLGNVWRDAGDEERALQYYEQAVAIYDKNFPGPYLFKALALEKIGTLQTSLGRLEDAEPALRKAYSMVLELEDQDRIPRVRFVLARCLFRLGQLHEAYDLLRENYESDWDSSAEGEAVEVWIQTLRGLSEIAGRLGLTDRVSQYDRELEALKDGSDIDGTQ